MNYNVIITYYVIKNSVMNYNVIITYYVIKNSVMNYNVIITYYVIKNSVYEFMSSRVYKSVRHATSQCCSTFYDNVTYCIIFNFVSLLIHAIRPSNIRDIIDNSMYV